MLGSVLRQLARRFRFRSRSAQPVSAGPSLEQGFALLLADDHAGAKRVAEQILDHTPGAPGACLLMAQVHGADGNLAAALSWVERSLTADAGYADGHFVRGLVLERLARTEDAIEAYERAASLAPTHAAALDWQGALHNARGEFDQSLACAQALVQIDPGNPDAHLKLGISLRELGRLAEAEEALRAAAALAPRQQEVRCRLALVLIDCGKFEEAQPILLQLLAQAPQHVEARWTAALHYLLQARFEPGWDYYEARETRRDGQLRLKGRPEWDGLPLTNGTLLVYAEQGLGDEIMFAACLQNVAALAPACILECDPRLEPLFRRSFPQIQVFGSRATQSPQWRDTLAASVVAQLPSGSLPRYFRRGLNDFPRHDGYLVPDAAKVSAWRSRLNALGAGPKIGLAWTGGTNKTRQRLRSIRLDELQPLLSRERCHFVSLQYVDSQGEIADLAAHHGGRLHTWPETLADYDETAALVAALDLVISVCTAVVHLAGALGTPVWVMVPAAPEWRYLRDGTTMPWYPSARLWRQQASGAWADVIALIGRELDQLGDTRNIRG